jgi:hypothetical protein
MILPLKRQDAAPTPNLAPSPTTFRVVDGTTVPYTFNISPTTFSTPAATYISTDEEGNSKTALAFKILVPIAGVILLVVRPPRQR